MSTPLIIKASQLIYELLDEWPGKYLGVTPSLSTIGLMVKWHYLDHSLQKTSYSQVKKRGVTSAVQIKHTITAWNRRASIRVFMLALSIPSFLGWLWILVSEVGQAKKTGVQSEDMAFGLIALVSLSAIIIALGVVQQKLSVDADRCK